MPELKLNNEKEGQLFEVDYEIGRVAVATGGFTQMSALTFYMADIDCSSNNYEGTGEVEQFLSRDEVVQLYGFLGKYLAETINQGQVSD